jgi:hypothetical protein
MYADVEEARSDFVLAAAMAIFGPLLFLLLRPLLFGGPGVLSTFIQAALVFAVMGLVPFLLARYRGQGAAAFGLDHPPREGIGAGIVIALPVIALGIFDHFSQFGVRPSILLGVIPPAIGGPVESLVSLLILVALFAGGLLLYTFLAAKARNAFAQNEIRQLEGLRTFGLSAAGLAVVVGLLVAAQGRITLTRLFLDPLTLGAVVLLTDRLVEPNAMTTRATVLAPAIVALVVRIELFGGQFLLTLHRALLGAGLVIVITMLIETKRYAWAVAPVLVAITLYQSPLSPFMRFAGVI